MHVRAEPAVLTVVCLYEAGAILTGRWPTITHWVMRLGRAGRAVTVLAASCWLASHFEVWRR